MASKKISVIIPTYNRSDVLPRALKSVLRQTYVPCEIIVVDDASTDNTVNVVNEFDDDRIEYIRHSENRHVSAARNTGIDASTGSYIAFLDDDDVWRPKKLEKQVNLLESASEKLGLVYCWMNIHTEKGVTKYNPTISNNAFPKILDKQPIGNASTLLVPRTVIDDIGDFDESLPRGNDGDFIRRVAKSYHIDFVPEILVDYHEDHSNERITRDDKEGIRNAIKGEEAKLEKFDMGEFPKRHSNILSMIAFHYWTLGDRKKAYTYYRRSISACPIALRQYLHIASHVKDIVLK